MTRAPGPRGGLIWGSLGAFQADPLGFLAQAAQEHGDIVRLRFGPVTAHLLNSPAAIEHVLSRNASNYDKATRSADRIAATTGDSLLSANAHAWERHRRLIQPVFQPKCFDGIKPVLDSLLDPMLARWRKAGRIDIVDEMMQLVIAAVIKVLFTSDIDPMRISAPLEVILADTWRRIEAPLNAAMLSPKLHRPAFKAAVRAVNDVVFDLIRQRRKCTQWPDDVLTRLLRAHEAEGEAQLSDTELRDAAVTLLLAGHETTANALSWAFIHLLDAPEIGDPARIFAEAIRLYPSIWVIERRAIAADVIDGFDIPRGSSVLISPYLLHRHPAFWPHASAFDPTRFAQGTPRPSAGYMPFGLGQHRCVGLYLANKMATHIIARVSHTVRLTLLPDQQPKTLAGITLRHEGPVLMRVTAD